MSLARDALKSVLLTNALPIAGLLFAICVTGYGAYAWRVRAAYHKGYATGSQVVRDSARVARQREKEAVADSTHRIAQQSSAPLAVAKQHFDSAPRHTPRIEAVPLPAGIDTSMIAVSVESTGERFILPRQAARYWYVSDSLVSVAQELLKKYASANRAWSEAWCAEHEARIGADSLAAMWRERALNAVAPPKQSHVKRNVVYATVGAVVALIARNQIHR